MFAEKVKISELLFQWEIGVTGEIGVEPPILTDFTQYFLGT